MHLFISYFTIFSLTNNLAFLLNFLSHTFLFILFKCHVDCVLKSFNNLKCLECSLNSEKSNLHLF